MNSNHINLKVVYWIKNSYTKFSSGLCNKYSLSVHKLIRPTIAGRKFAYSRRYVCL